MEARAGTSRLSRMLLRSSAIVFCSAIVFLSLPLTVFADSGTIGGKPAYPDPENERTKSIFIKTLSPGASAGDGVKVVNTTDAAKTIRVYATDSVPSSGGAFACAQAADDPKSVGKWVTLSQQAVTVPSGSATTVKFTVTTPTSVEPGEHNGCIVLQEDKDRDFQGGVGLNFRTAIRLAVLIPGDIIKQLTPQALDVTTTSKKVVVTPTVKNTGNVSLDTNINISLTTLFGSTVAAQTYTYPIFPDQASSWNFDLDLPFWGGFYKASYSLSYDESDNYLGQTIDAHIKRIDGLSRWVFLPPSAPALLLLLVGFVGTGTVTVLLVRTFIMRRERKRHWIRRAVRPNEQLHDIAKAYNVSWQLLARVNKLKPPYPLTTGQVIKVPPARHEKPKNRKK